MSIVKVVGIAVAAMLASGAACRPVPEDRASKFALAAGQATMVLGVVTNEQTMKLGSCQKPLGMGYVGCQLTKGTPMPNIQLFFTNPASYSISDCALGIYKTGQSKGGELVEVDMSGLNDQIQSNGFCIMRVEAIEYYPDNNDSHSLRPVALAGGFFTEILDSDYQPVPPADLTAWCYQVSRTTKGRTIVQECDAYPEQQ